MNLGEIADAVQGRLSPECDPQARLTGSVEHDSRQVSPGGLFVALAGERVDGHDFAAAAHADGAVAILAAREVGVPAIVVDDVLAAYGRLARTVIERIEGLTVIGITGSSGKTSTKDFLAHVLSQQGAVVAPEGNLNNELGLPYTVCRADESTRYLVLEMGARGVGHIEYLCRIAPVDVGVVLNVGNAHLGEFGSVEAIARAKGELVEAVPPEGLVVLNADDPVVAAMRSRAVAPVTTFGVDPEADVCGEDVDPRDGRARYTLRTPKGRAEVNLRLYGLHQVSNTLAAAAASTGVGMEPAAFSAAANSPFTVSARRMDVFTRHDDAVTVIDDSYNANPGSMAAALDALAQIGDQRRKIAVLGYMAELGDAADAEHAALGQRARAAGADVLIAVEPGAWAIADAACDSADESPLVVRAADQAEAIAQLESSLCPADVVLVKGSRYRTWKVADHLRSGQPTPKEAHA